MLFNNISNRPFFQ